MVMAARRAAGGKAGDKTPIASPKANAPIASPTPNMARSSCVSDPHPCRRKPKVITRHPGPLQRPCPVPSPALVLPVKRLGGGSDGDGLRRQRRWPQTVSLGSGGVGHGGANARPRQSVVFTTAGSGSPALDGDGCKCPPPPGWRRGRRLEGTAAARGLTGLGLDEYRRLRAGGAAG